MNVKGCYLSLIVVDIKENIKDIRLWDIFDIFFLLKKIIHFIIRGPLLYELKKIKLIGEYKWINI